MSNWVVDIQARLPNASNGWSQDEQLGRMKKSIYKVPPHIKQVNNGAYQPHVVSFGPYHHGEPHLASMETHKERALLRYIHQVGRPLQEVFDFIAEVAQELKDSYDSLDSKWQYSTEGFVQLMILDGCFMLEMLRVAYQPENYYFDNDPIFSRHGELYIMPFIKADMLLLENQLPILLLLRLMHVLEKVEPDIEALNKDILWLLDYDITKYSEMGKCLHVLDLYRKSLLHRDNGHGNVIPQSPNQLAPQFLVQEALLQSPNQEAPQSLEQGEGNYPKMDKCLQKLDCYRKCLLHTHNKPRDTANQSPSHREGKVKEISRIGHNVVRPATELHEAGVCFMKSNSNNLRDITFDGGILKLPNFMVDDDTESKFLNLLAFERCHIPAGNSITSFISFMDHIINNNADIELLSSIGIINNAIGSDREAANLFNTMAKNLVFHVDGELGQVYRNLIDYSNIPWNKWRANLTQTYFKSPNPTQTFFRNPWAITSIIAASILFCLTVVQTVFTILN